MVIAALKGRPRPVAFHEMYKQQGSFELRMREIDADQIEEMEHFFPHRSRQVFETFAPVLAELDSSSLRDA